MQLQQVPPQPTAELIALLKAADEDETRIRQAVEDAANTAYMVVDAEACVGAVVMRWQPEESEILYIAVDESMRGRGYGKAAIALIIAQARRDGIRAVTVGTANSSLDNIAFYQKCGFRMDSIRKQYFDYLPAPVYEFGIRMRDMLMLRFEVSPGRVNA